jgi:UDP-N-acetylglucosamine 2-epimerase (non-hydrolysing)
LESSVNRIAVIFGTRPEAIKMAPVVLALRREPDTECRVCVTGQHQGMLEQVLNVFDIAPESNLALMRPGQELASLTARIVEGVDAYLRHAKPGLVLVQGDTTTTFAAALAAFYLKIPLGHVEAGLRTGDLFSPWPEEANRILTSRLANFHFAATERNRQSLIAEGVAPHSVLVTGNPVIDALFLALHKVRESPPAIAGLSRCDWRDHSFVLITGHRRENFGLRLESICRALAELARLFPSVNFIYPVHLNPNVREPVDRLRATTPLPNLRLIEPVGYLEFVALMERCTLILTDSGGIQEEAPSLGKPVLVMRDTTERPEAVELGCAKLIGTSQHAIVTETALLLADSKARSASAQSFNPYGDGHAAERIAAACSAAFRDRNCLST